VSYIVLLATISPLAVCQVDHSIDQDEDLLAVDSIDNEVSFRRPILAPPPSFAKIGARLQAAPRGNTVAGGHGAAIVQKSRMEADGSYAFNYETNDGVRRQESGQPSSSQTGSIVQSGSWSYTGLDGKLYEVSFVADELGYRPVGGHIHPAHQQAQRQARRLAGQRQKRQQRGQTGRNRQQEVRTRGQEGRTRAQEGRARAQEERTRSQETRTRPQNKRTRFSLRSRV